MSSVNSPQVLIVGSGPAGLLLALTLLKNGVDVRIIEKNTEHHVGERGAGIMPRTLEIENFLGVGDEVRNTGLGWPKNIQIFDPQDPHRIMKIIQAFEKAEPTPAFPITEGVMIGQWLHLRILRKHIENLGYQVELGCALSSLEQQEDGVVAHLAKTANGEQVEETAKFAYVVGADGAHSTVRKQLGVSFVGESRDERIYPVDARIEGMQASEDLYKWGDRTKNTAIMRPTVEAGVFQLLLAGPGVNFDALQTGTVDAVQAEFNKISRRTDLKITQIISQSEWRPNMRIANRFRDGRVFIIGDAAHVHTPAGGQGLNSSIQDSFNLAWKLALVLKGRTSSTLLDSFEVERIPVIAEMLNITTELYHKMWINADARQALLAAESLAPDALKDNGWFRSRKLFQLDLNYRWSSIVFDERFEKHSEKNEAYGIAGHDVRAGDRAPDASRLTRLDAGEGERTITRLFDIFDPSLHTVLIFSLNPSDSTTQSLLNSLAKLPDGLVRSVLILPAGALGAGSTSLNVDYVFKDSEGHAYEGYGLGADAGRAAAVIIRPDAMIGAFAISAAGVDKYLLAVFNSV